MDQGKATYVSIAFPIERIHPAAREASEAAECAARQGRYWKMHEGLFESPSALARADLRKLARSIGLDAGRFETCLSGEASAQIDASLAEGRRLQVVGTPTFFVGRFGRDGSIESHKRIIGAADLDDFLNALAEISGGI